MEKTKIFIAYAREDAKYLNNLLEFLKPLERSESIEMWYDGEILPGEAWDTAIKEHLHNADIIMLLVSSNSLASDYFYDNEMKSALARHEREEAIVVPIILRHCPWNVTELSKLQALPKDAKPITAWEDESAAYNNVFEGIHQNVQIIQKRKKQATFYAAPISSQPTTSDTVTKPASSNKSNNFGKILKIALPVLIGIIAIFWLVNWMNNEPDPISGVIEPPFAPCNKDNGENADLNNELKNPLPAPIERLIDEMVSVKGGTFQMGCTDEQLDCRNHEKPVHKVTLDDFTIGKYEVTQDQWGAVIGTDPSFFKKCGNRCPVEQVSWNDIQKFIRKLNKMTGRRFRLPTEAEWEYVARGGKRNKKYKYAGSNDLNTVAWYDENSNNKGRNHQDYGAHTVGTKSKIRLGLSVRDMSGNLSEWCNDWYDESYYTYSPTNNPSGPKSARTYKVVRGGSWMSDKNSCRVSYRGKAHPTDTTMMDTGFRLVSCPD